MRSSTSADPNCGPAGPAGPAGPLRPDGRAEARRPAEVSGPLKQARAALIPGRRPAAYGTLAVAREGATGSAGRTESPSAYRESASALDSRTVFRRAGSGPWLGEETRHVSAARSPGPGPAPPAGPRAAPRRPRRRPRPTGPA